ncbi:SIMPL domain-containing protein [Planktotalea sp.]|uniref:SIMPL domain-containing protein n=1 Tax=Planktotalea sp. TaxID=2029877 RepID=UPI003D6A8A5C
MPLKYWLFLFSLALAPVFGAPLHAEQLRTARTIEVIGDARVSAAPDKAVITLGARHTAKSAADALAQTNQAVAAILSRMTDLGVEKSDVQTSSLNLNPVWGNSSRYDDGEIVPPIGFEASSSVQVTLRDLDQLGVVLDQVTQVGANSFSGFRFGLIDPEPVLDQAREAAVADARRKAALYAKAAGVELGGVFLITEILNSSVGQPMMMREMASARSGGVPIAQGEVSESAQVKLIFEIVEK